MLFYSKAIYHLVAVRALPLRMENSVLGNALEGVPEESSEESEKQNDSKIESADNLDGGCFFCSVEVSLGFNNG